MTTHIAMVRTHILTINTEPHALYANAQHTRGEKRPSSVDRCRENEAKGRGDSAVLRLGQHRAEHSKHLKADSTVRTRYRIASAEAE
eukprot:399256-Rhodomonas_salina.2